MDLPSDLVVQQVTSIVEESHPKAIKIGLVRNAETLLRLRREICGCNRLVVAPVLFSSNGSLLVGEEIAHVLLHHIIPDSLLLMLRCRDAEYLLQTKISTDDDMKEAARKLYDMGAQWVLLRGGQHTQGQLTALLYGGEDEVHFFSSYNTDGWQKHGVGSAMSAAIATRLGLGDDVPTAIRNAHHFVHSQVVYVQDKEDQLHRPIDLYNQFVSLVTNHYTEAHDVAFYADKLCISTRYLSKVTEKTVSKSPKQIISDYLTNEAKNYLKTTRLTIQEIAFRLGFSSQTMFCKFFKAQEGRTPSEVRG